MNYRAQPACRPRPGNVKAPDQRCIESQLKLIKKPQARQVAFDESKAS